jgi:hypothetical protein
MPGNAWNKPKSMVVPLRGGAEVEVLGHGEPALRADCESCPISSLSNSLDLRWVVCSITLPQSTFAVVCCHTTGLRAMGPTNYGLKLPKLWAKINLSSSQVDYLRYLLQGWKLTSTPCIIRQLEELTKIPTQGLVRWAQCPAFGEISVFTWFLSSVFIQF